MAEISCIKGFPEAIASERKDRATCLLGLPELIAGVQCGPLTPRRLEWLRAFHNPFICGGASSTASLLQFLWFISLEFSFDASAEKRDLFIETILSDWLGGPVDISITDEEVLADFLANRQAEKIAECVEGIGEYLDRAFLDAPHGKPGKPYYAPTIGLYHSLNASYPHGEWTLDKVLDTPLAVIYQLIKVDDAAKGCTIINRRSDEIAVKWAEQLETITIPMPELPKQAACISRLAFMSDEAFEDALINSDTHYKAACDEILAAHEQAVVDEIAKRKADGWMLMTQPSQNNDGSYSFAMQRREAD